MRGDRETTFCLDQLNYLTKHDSNCEFRIAELRNSAIRNPKSLILSLPLPLSFNLFEQLIDSLALFLYAIAHEMKLGRAWQIQRKTKLFPNIRRRVLQRRKYFPMLFFVAGNGDINTGRS